MFKIRRGTFETNSSSTHSICICTQEEYNKWKKGELVYNYWQEELRTVAEEDVRKLAVVHNSLREAEENGEDISWEDREFLDNYLTYDEAQERNEYQESYNYSFTTPSGDKMIAFGWYGHD